MPLNQNNYTSMNVLLKKVASLGILSKNQESRKLRTNKYKKLNKKKYITIIKWLGLIIENAEKQQKKFKKKSNKYKLYEAIIDQATEMIKKINRNNNAANNPSRGATKGNYSLKTLYEQHGITESVWNRIKKQADGLYVVHNSGGSRTGINTIGYANQCFYISISDWYAINRDTIIDIGELKKQISQTKTYILNPNTANTNLMNPVINNALNAFCEREKIRITVHYAVKGNILPSKYPGSTTWEPHETNYETPEIHIISYGSHFELIVFSDRINYNIRSDPPKTRETLEDYEEKQKGQLATFASLIGKISNVDDFANVMYESSYQYQPFYKRAMNILFNMQNSDFDYSIFKMYLDFAKLMKEPQKFNLADKLNNNRSNYPETREFIGLLDQLRFDRDKRTLLMFEWNRKMTPEKSVSINAPTTNSTNAGEVPNTVKSQWTQYYNEKTKQYYYYNSVTDTSQWNVPNGFVEAAQNRINEIKNRAVLTTIKKIVFFDLDETLVFKCGDAKQKVKGYVKIGTFNRSTSNIHDVSSVFTSQEIIDLLKYINNKPDCTWCIISHGQNVSFLDFFNKKGVKIPEGHVFLGNKSAKSIQVNKILSQYPDPKPQAIFVGDNETHNGEAAHGANILFIQATGQVQCQPTGQNFSFPTTILSSENIKIIQDFIDS